MPDQQGLQLFLQAAVMLGAALAVGWLARRWRQPAVLGELMAGILLGPTVLSRVAPGVYGWLFPAEGGIVPGLEAIIRIGMLFFLFVAGLEVNLARVRHRATPVALTSTFGILIPFALGVISVLVMPGIWQPPVQDGLWVFAAFVGTALSISALPVIARILLDLQLMKQEIGAVVMAAATINDIIGWSAFTAVLSRLEPGGPGRGLLGTLALMVAFAAVLLAAGRWLGPPALRWAKSTLAWPSGLIALSAVLVLLAAAGAEALGIEAIFGAFLVGVALGQVLEFKNNDQVQETIYQFTISFFAPLYFVSVGIRVDFLANLDLPLVVLVIALASAGKIVGASLGARLGGMAPWAALGVGAAMNARGAMEIILASVALEHGLIDQRIFVALVIMAMVTSMACGPALQYLAGRRPASVATAPLKEDRGSGS